MIHRVNSKWLALQIHVYVISRGLSLESDGWRRLRHEFELAHDSLKRLAPLRKGFVARVKITIVDGKSSGWLVWFL